MITVIEFSSPEIANRVAEHLYHIRTEDAYLICSGFDIAAYRAFLLATSLECVTKADYVFADAREVALSVCDSVESCILHVLHWQPIQKRGSFWGQVLVLKVNKQLFRLWEFLLISNSEKKALSRIDAAVLIILAKKDCQWEYTLIVHSGILSEEITFCPYREPYDPGL